MKFCTKSRSINSFEGMAPVAGEWASPRPELLAVRAHVHRIVNDERALMTLHLAAQSFEPARKPKIILMEKTSPIAHRFTQAEIGGGYPVPKPSGSDQSNGKSIRITTHNLEGLIRGPIIDNHQLDSVVDLVPYTFERSRDEPLAVVSRHNN